MGMASNLSFLMTRKQEKVTQCVMCFCAYEYLLIALLKSISEL